MSGLPGQSWRLMSAFFEGKAEKRLHHEMSAFDPKRTWDRQSVVSELWGSEAGGNLERFNGTSKNSRLRQRTASFGNTMELAFVCALGGSRYEEPTMLASQS